MPAPTLTAQLLNGFAAGLLLISFSMLSQRRTRRLIELFAWQGAILFVTRLSEALARSVPLRLVYRDDAARGAPPESSPGTVPLVGYDGSLVGVLQLLNKQDGAFGEQDEGIATALGAQCAVALQRARMLDELVAKEKMERELAVARDIQMRVLPKKVP